MWHVGDCGVCVVGKMQGRQSVKALQGSSFFGIPSIHSFS